LNRTFRQNLMTENDDDEQKKNRIYMYMYFHLLIRMTKDTIIDIQVVSEGRRNGQAISKETEAGSGKGRDQHSKDRTIKMNAGPILFFRVRWYIGCKEKRLKINAVSQTNKQTNIKLN